MDRDALLETAQAVLEENQRLRDEVKALRLMLDQQRAEMERLIRENAVLSSRVRRQPGDEDEN